MLDFSNVKRKKRSKYWIDNCNGLHFKEQVTDKTHRRSQCWSSQLTITSFEGAEQLTTVSIIQSSIFYHYYIFTAFTDVLKFLFKSLNLTQLFLSNLHFSYSLKPNSHLPKRFVIWSIESRLKMMKNAFYFTSKALFVLKICKFLS